MAEQMNRHRMPELRYEERALRTMTGKLLFAPVGHRASVAYLDRLPGFSGRFDLIHKTNLTELFTMVCGISADWESAQSVWYPDRLDMRLETESFVFEEKKYLLEDDLAVAVQQWTNRGDEPLELCFRSQPVKAHSYVIEEGWLAFETPDLTYGYAVAGVSTWRYMKPGEERLSAVGSGRLVIAPGEGPVTVTGYCQLGNLKQESVTELKDKLVHYLEAHPAPDAGVQASAEWEEYLAKAPSFTCSLPIYEQTWNYRWLIMKHCTSFPGWGNFRQAVMYEGRSHKMSPAPLESKGWEFTKLIPLSTPLHLMDYRWRDPALAHEFIRTFLDSADEDGIPRSMVTNGYMASYANFGIWAIYQLYLVDGDEAFLREILPALKAFVEGHRKVHGDPDDELPIEYVHARTGKEYPPSYWYFGGYPDNPKDKTHYTPLKRVDRSVYHYLNAKGLAAICRVLEDADAPRYEALTERIAADIESKMWDPETKFYYDLHYQTDEKAMVRNIVGFYPWWAGIAPHEGIEALTDPAEFATGSGFPSVSRQSEIYEPDGGWRKLFFKGRNGCVWDGPSWPYTTAIALSALSNESRRQGHRFDADYARFFREYTAEHFRDGDLRRPYLVEHYNPESGEPLSDEPDYNHSYWIDLVVQDIAGFRPQPDGIRIEPLDIGLGWYCLKDLRYRGHVYEIRFARKPRPDMAEGLTILRDGSEIYHGSGPVDLTPDGRVLN